MLIAHLILTALAHGHHHHFALCSQPFLTVNRWTGVVTGTGITCPAR